MRRTAVSAGLLSFVFATTPAAAQYGQYTAPGAGGISSSISAETVRAATEEARWKVGPLRLDPVAELREIAWIDPGEGESGDLTASVAVGLRGYLPLGARSTLLLHAVPQYVWWRERDDASRWGGESGLGLVIDARRLQVELRAGGSDLDGFVASELDERARVDQRALSGRAELLVSSRIGLWAKASRGTLEVESERDLVDDPLANLDRTDSAFDLGVRWHPTSTLALGVGVGTSRARFESGARDRSNSGESITADLSWTRPKLGISFQVRDGELEPEADSEFTTFSGSTGSGRIVWSPRERFSVALFGIRSLAYTAADDSAWFLDQRQGVEIGLRLSRFAVSGFLETGENRFEGGRLDDVDSIGGSLSAELGRLSLRIGLRSTERSGDGGDRSYEQLSFSLGYGKLRASWL